MKKLITISIFAFFIQSNFFSQKCYTNVLLEKAKRDNPSIVDNLNDIEIFTKNWTQNNANRSASVNSIPVVIHVVWNQAIENISDAQIMSQIDVLNEDFRALNADISYTPTDFQNLTADCEIKFCLASVDPNGLPTTGIIRKQTNIAGIGDPDANGNKIQFTAQGGSDAWNTNNYLNIWIGSFGTALTLGYAYIPGSAPSIQEDGAVIDYRRFGATGTVQAPNDLGRTVTHEIGHYFNLRHVWGDDGGCTDDDLVNDTPMQDSANYGTPNHPDVSCGSADMFMNFMDYVDDDYMVMFSYGQKLRMKAALNGPRASLLTSNGCGLVSSIHENDELTFNLYPNPSHNNLNIDFKNKKENYNIILYNTVGKEVYKKVNVTSFHKINIRGYKTGIYYLSINGNKSSIKKKVLIK